LLVQVFVPWLNPASPTPLASPTPTTPTDNGWVQVGVPTITGVTEIIGALIGLATVALLLYTLLKTIEIAKANTEMARANAGALEEMREARHAQTAPYVIVYIEIYGHTIVNLVMENLGESVAENVSLTFVPPLDEEYIIGKKLPTFITDITPNLAPRQKMQRWLFQMADPLHKRVPAKYEVSVSYEGGIFNRTYKHIFKLDIESFLGTNEPEDARVKALNEGFKAITDASKETAKAIKETKDALDPHLIALAATSYQTKESFLNDSIGHFKALVRGLSADWRAWQAHKDPEKIVPAQFIEERLLLSAHAVMTLAPYLPIPNATLDDIRSLIFDIQVVAWKILYRWDGVEEQITEKIKELEKIADSLEDSVD
jgi:tetrahydromethanopterin S-methyltransferase subunit B/DNA-directed RNA polymerase subunit L